MNYVSLSFNIETHKICLRKSKKFIFRRTEITGLLFTDEKGNTVEKIGRGLFWIVRSKGKGKVRPRAGLEGPEEEQKYSSTLSL